jgi:hypothetical protein
VDQADGQLAGYHVAYLLYWGPTAAPRYLDHATLAVDLPVQGLRVYRLPTFQPGQPTPPPPRT